MRGALLLVIAMAAAGCVQDGPEGQGGPDEVSLWGTVYLGEVPYPGVVITLESAGGIATTVTGDDGTFRFDGLQRGPCQLVVETPDGDEQTLSTQCPRELTIRIAAGLEPGSRPVSGPRTPLGTDTVVLEAVVVDEEGRPRALVDWTAVQADEPVAAGRTSEDGSLRVEAPPGLVQIHLETPCLAPATFSVELSADLERTFTLRGTPPPAVGIPTGVAAHDGPLDGLTIAWGPVPGARGYEVTDGKQVVLTGARAWGDHTPSGPYRIRAVDPCGQETAWSTQVDGAGLTPAHPSLLADAAASPDVHVENFAVLDLGGNAIGSVPWRVVEGTGNCCENYVATTRDGWVLDFGGNTLFVSNNEGQTWREYTNHGAQICGEGAVVPGPAGDIYGMNWELCLGAGTDGVWSVKYIAADDAWVEGSQLLHAPFFDRPWMSVGAGPQEGPAGSVAPVKAYIFTNIHDSLHGTGHGVSPDGVTYLPDTGLLASAYPSGTFPDALAFDPDADWTQPQIETHGRSLDPGLHIIDLGLAACSILDTPTGRACAPHDLPVRSMQRDSDGRLHAIVFNDDARTITYRWSDDVGRSWESRDFPYIPQIASDGGREWDFKAHAQIGRAALSMHTVTPDGSAVDLVYVFRDISGKPVIDQILQVGEGGGTGASGVAADERYDFMSSGFLPDGRIVLSYRDGTLDQPAVAIALTT